MWSTVIEICYNDLLGSIFPLCFFSSAYQNTLHLSKLEPGEKKPKQPASGRCHAKACITHHPSAHFQECSSSISQLFPLTGTNSKAQNCTSIAISKRQASWWQTRLPFYEQQNKYSCSTQCCIKLQWFPYLLLAAGITSKPSSAPEQLPAEHPTMTVLYPWADIQRAWHLRSILSGHKFLLSLWLVFSIRSDLEKK